MTQQKIAVSEDHASTPIKITIYNGLYESTPRATDTLTWAEFGDEIEQLIAQPATHKHEMLAIGPYHLRAGTTRANANVERMSAVIGLDVDKNLADLDTLLDTIRAYGIAAYVFTSASDPDPDSRRVRVFLLSEEHAPEQCWAVRRAAAEVFGVIVDPQTKDPSRLLFAGVLEGTSPRELYRIDGGPLRLAWLNLEATPDPIAKPRAKPVAGPSTADPSDRVALVTEIIEPHYQEQRHSLTRALGSWLAKRSAFGAWSDTEIRAMIEALPSDQTPKRVRDALAAAAQARAGETRTIGWKELAERLGDDAARLERAAMSAWELRYEVTWAARDQARAESKKAKPAVANDNDNTEPTRSWAVPAADTAKFAGPYILQARNDAAHVLLWDGDDRGHQPVAVGSLRLCIQKLKLAEPDGPIALSFTTTSKNGEPKTVKLPVQSIIENHGQPFERAVYDFAERASHYDAANDSVIVGYPDVCTAAAFDADVDTWLRALGGDAYPRLAAWIASCSQRHIKRLAAALVFLGPADVGKTFFACAVAGLWGADEPPSASLLVERFNGDLKRCPTILDDEAQLFGSKTLSTKRFREVSQSAQRSIEHKGREKFQLRGALRLMVACNGLTDLRFTDMGGPDVVNAVEDRLCIIDAKLRAADCKAALAKLRLPDAWLCGRDRVVAHMAWLAETVELPVERFIGAGGDAGDSVLAGQIDEHVDLWETFRDWLDGAGAGTQWYTSDGQLCADPSTLARSLEHTGRGWSLRDVRNGLTPFHTGDCRPKLTDGKQPRLWVLDATRAAKALSLDPEQCKTLTDRVAKSVSPAQPRDSQSNKWQPKQAKR